MRTLLILAGAAGAAVAVGVIGLVFFSTHGSQPAVSISGPQLAMNGESFDLGDVPADRTVERTVEFQNSGLEPLAVSIVKVRAAPDAACGCGVEGFEVRPESVAPSGAGQLVFMLRVPTEMPDMEDRMIAELRTNDPTRPTLTISIVFRMAS